MSARRALLVAFLALGIAGSALADGTEPPDWAYGMTHDLMSPFCPGRTLAACPSPQADQLRLWILQQASAGRSRQSIEEQLYHEYGEIMRASPKAEGWGLSAYAIPIVGFFAGGLVAWLALRRIVRRGDAAPFPPSPPSAPEPPAPAPGPGRAPASASDDELERLVDQELAAR